MPTDWTGAPAQVPPPPRSTLGAPKHSASEAWSHLLRTLVYKLPFHFTRAETYARAIEHRTRGKR